MNPKPDSPKAGYEVVLARDTIGPADLALKRVRRHFVFHGHVQHCGFRITSYRFAKEHRITGWVYNRGDGCVEMEAQGEQAQLWMFRSQLLGLKGRVTRLEETTCPTVEGELQYLVLAEHRVG